MDKNELSKWCEEMLSTKKKIINANYTRNNYSLLKKNFPDMWKYLEGQTINIKGKDYTFQYIEQREIYINGILYHNGGRCGKYKLHDIINDLNNEFDNNVQFLDIVQKVISLKYSGVRLLKICEKCYPDTYKFIMENYYNKGQTERETIYRYLHNVKERPMINNVILKFLTYDMGYNSIKLKEMLEDIELNDEKSVVRTIITNGSYGLGSKDLKLFFPSLYNKINNMYNSNIKMCSKMFLFVNDMVEIPDCIYCKKKCNPLSSGYGFHIFCSLICARKYEKEIIRGINWDNIKNNKIRSIKKYYRLVSSYTEESYLQYHKKINPKNLKRGRNKYHLDHIIPKIYGFVNDIHPEIIGNYRNLQMLSEYENCSKAGTIYLTKIEEKELIKSIKEDIYG